MSTTVWGQRGSAGAVKDVLDAPSRRGSSGSGTPQVLCLTWNHDATCLAVGTTDGFLVYSTETIASGSDLLSAHRSEGHARQSLAELTRRTVPGGVGLISLHMQSNVILFSGGSRQTESVVTLWDDSRCEVGATSDSEDGDAECEGGCTADAAHGAAADTLPTVSVAERCTVATFAMPAPVAALRFHSHVIIVAEPFRVHLYDSRLTHLTSFPGPNHGIRSTDQRERGSAGMTWDYSSQALGLAALSVAEVYRGVNCLVTRGVLLGPTAGSVRCFHYFTGEELREPRGGGLVERSVRNRSGSGVGSGAHAPGVASRGQTSVSLGGYSVDDCVINDNALGVMQTKLVHPAPHTHRIQALAISADGSRALSVSEQGTTLKLIDVARATVQRQFNRGITTSLVSSLTFSVDNTMSMCISSNGTVHLFELSTNSASVSPRDHAGSGGLSSWAGTIAQRGLQSLQYVAPTSAAVSGLSAFVASDYAAYTFTMNFAESTKSAAVVPAVSLSAVDDTERSAQSRAYLSEYADAVLDSVEISENTGFDPLFTALAFRPRHSVRDARVDILVASGSIVPREVRMKSRVVQVTVPTRKPWGADVGRDASTGGERQSGSSGGGDGGTADTRHIVTATCLFPRDRF